MTVYWRPFMELAVGESAIKIALAQSVFEKARPFLD
jgi:hypothetical protein